MEFFRTPHFKYIANRKYFFWLSGLLGIMTVISLLTRGPNLSIDFTGGTLVEATFTKAAVSIGDVRKALDQAGLKDPQLQSVPGQNTVIIRFKSEEGLKQELATQIEAALAKAFPDNPVDKNRTRAEYVGPVVGKHLVGQAMLAIFFSMLGIAVYVAFRFKSLVWGVSGVFALVHDVFLTVGFLSLFNREISITVVAALLTLAGYSINDTIVIFDRIRENIRLRGRAKEPLDVLIDRSCNETLSRTIITSLTVFLVLISLLVFGGEVIRDFSLALTFGVVIGSYSTIFIASPIVYLWVTRRNKTLR